MSSFSFLPKQPQTNGNPQISTTNDSANIPKTLKTSAELEALFESSGSKDAITGKLIEELNASGFVKRVEQLAEAYIEKRNINDIDFEGFVTSIRTNPELSIPEPARKETYEQIRGFVEKNIAKE
uniref:Transcription and mRNA export factor ENY2 n=1 Tax=Rhabditophanes sp. KR3021 TaxID=114890 RepID=A0AC35TG92_9BILA